MLDLSLRYEANGTAHDDLVLRFAGETWIGDSYYLALDRKVLPEDESPTKVKVVLRTLLEYWFSIILNLENDGTTFLPFDFSDQSTGWLRCQREGNEITVSQGQALVEGHSLFPSAVGDHSLGPVGFKVDGPTMKVSWKDLLQAIRESSIDVA